MSEVNNKLVTRIVEENSDLKTQLQDANDEIEKLKTALADKVAINEKEASEMEGEVAAAKVEAEDAKIEAETAKQKAEAAEDKLAEIEKVVAEELGEGDAVSVLKEVSEKFHKTLDQYEQLVQISESMGDISESAKAISMAGAAPAELMKIFEEYGTVQQMADAIDAGTARLLQIEEENKVAELVRVGSEYGMSEEAVQKLAAKFSIETAEDLKEFFELTNQARKEEDNPEVQMGESFNKIMTGSAFANRRQIDESYNGRFQREQSIGQNSPERAARLI